MNLSLLIVVTLVLSAKVLASSEVIEQRLHIDNVTEALFNPSIDKTPSACVLMIHGWVSNMEEVGGMFTRLARDLSMLGIASLRINIRGESERKKSNYRLTSTYQSRISDSERGLTYLKSRCKNKPIGIVGFSLGGVTAISLAGSYPSDIDSIVLWSSAINPSEIFNTIKPKSVIREVIERGEGVFDGFEKITITKQHYLGMQGYTPLDNLKKYEGALLTIRGTGDFVPMYDVTIMNASSSQESEFRLIKGADHIFNTFDVDKRYDQKVISYTTQWFNSTLN